MKPATTGERIVLDDLADNEHALRQLRTDGKYTRKALLARAIDAAIAEAVKAEREAIAVLCETHQAVTVLKPNKGEPRQRLEPFYNDGSQHAGQVYAAAIRARGNP